MGIIERIDADLKTALKSGDALRAGVFRFVRAQFHNREIEKRGKGAEGALTDEEAADVLRKEMKKRKEAIELFEKGGRADLKEKEEAELNVIAEYLPAQPTREELVALVEALKKEGISDFPALMREAKKRLPAADGGEIAKIARGQ